MAGRRKLSELEGVSLGIVSKLQPCTAYRVRRELKESPSSHWQASAGALYPLLARLEAEKLISKSADKQDGRGRQLLKLSARGRKSLKAWMLTGADPERVAAISDPIRSRVFFLEQLDKQERSAYINDLISLMEAYLSKTKARQKKGLESDDSFDQLAALGAIYVTRARLAWLNAVRKKLSL